jgi:pimeloyl-ACP methyl ester carboxylesterase
VVLGHSFGATTALTYAALFPENTAAVVAVGAFGMGPEADAQGGGAAEAEAQALLARHARSPWYAEARPVFDAWTERLLATTQAAEMEQMMATILPFYLAEPDKPEVAARLAEMTRAMKANLAAGQAWEGGLYQSVDLRPLLVPAAAASAWASRCLEPADEGVDAGREPFVAIVDPDVFAVGDQRGETVGR